jgi:hypothetical protein
MTPSILATLKTEIYPKLIFNYFSKFRVNAFGKIHQLTDLQIHIAYERRSTIMTRFLNKSGTTFLKLLPIALVIMAGTAWAEDGTTLSADELEALIMGATRSGKYAGGTYYLTFQDDGSYCLRLDSNKADCVEKGPWWFEGNTVCRKSNRSGEYCWNVTKIDENKFRSEITRVKGSNKKIGRKREFWME